MKEKIAQVILGFKSVSFFITNKQANDIAARIVKMLEQEEQC